MKTAFHFQGVPISWRSLVITLVVAIVLLAVPTVLNPYQTLMFSYGLVFAVAALGFNLLLGYTGLTSFGHSAYFGVGAYAVAFGVKYLGITSMELHIVIGVVAAALISALFGFLCVRFTLVFFSILTLALSQVLWSLAYKFFWVTGGTDGIRVPRPSLLGGLFTFKGGGDFLKFVNSYYYYLLVIFAVCVGVMWLIVHSPFGKALQAIRDNATRAEFIAVRVWHYKFMAFLISGIFTGLAGVLWVPLNGLTTPDVLYWPFSGEFVFMTVLGGFRNFTGPIVGAVIFNYLKTYAVATTEYWQFMLGATLIVLVMALPAGIVGTAMNLWSKLRKGA
jgi:branched-chain amino acid transport system permease protein